MYLMQSPPGAKILLDGRQVDYFCGCGYFSLQGHPEVIDAACRAVRQYGLGSATSRGGFGINPALVDVERKAAKFLDTETALYFVSGYLGTAILLNGIQDDFDLILIDEHSHDSAFDGVAIVGKPVIAFAHRDADDLKQQLARHLKPSQRPLVLTDGVFPVSGEVAPLVDYVDVLRSYDGFTLCVDDAHALGVIGKKGRGTFEYLGLSGTHLHGSGTLSKALGGHGGILAGDRNFIDRLETSHAQAIKHGRAARQHTSRIPIASSPPSTPVAAASAKALEILDANPQLRMQLWANTNYAKDRLRAIGFHTNRTPVPILCVTSKRMNLEALPSKLLEKDIVISPFFAGDATYSSVPESGALRIAIFSSHTKEQIDRLFDEIARLV